MCIVRCKQFVNKLKHRVELKRREMKKQEEDFRQKD
jgi:hypothetical protein